MLLEEAYFAWVSQSYGDGVYTSATSPPDPPPPTNNTQLQQHLLPSAGTVVPEPAPPLPTTGRQQGHDRNYPLSQLHLQLPQANGASRSLPPSTTPLTEHPSHQDHEKRPPRRLNDRQGRKRRHGTVRERIHPIPHQRRSLIPLIRATPPPNQAPRLTHVSPHSRRHRLLLRAPHHLRRRHPRRDAQNRLRKLRRGPPTLSPRLQSTEGRPLPEVEDERYRRRGRIPQRPRPASLTPKSLPQNLNLIACRPRRAIDIKHRPTSTRNTNTLPPPTCASESSKYTAVLKGNANSHASCTLVPT